MNLKDFFVCVSHGDSILTQWILHSDIMFNDLVSGA